MAEGNTEPCTLEFVSVGCNSGANCMDWGRNTLVAYGGCNFVALYHPQTYQTVATLCGHTGRVNGVKWIPNLKFGIENRWEQDEFELISASTDKSLIVWRKDQDKWVQTAKLTGHTESVTAVAVVDLADGSLYAASTSCDATLRIWFRPSLDAQWTCVQTIARAPKMFEAVSIARLPSPSTSSSSSSSPAVRESVIVAAGGVDGGIHLFAQQHAAETQAETQQQFKQVVVLEGHQDWIRCLSFTTTDSHNLLLASSSQDNRVRLWSVAPLEGSQMATLLSDNADSRISSKGHVVDLKMTGEEGTMKFVVLLDAVLAVHEDWVYSVAWAPRVRDAKTQAVHQPMRLLSASMDRTMIVWEPASTGGGIWLDNARMGEMGGNTLGFYGCAFSPSGDAILAHGYLGAFHMWKRAAESAPAEEGEDDFSSATWEPVVTVSGHFAGVEDLSWDTTGTYFVTVSEDKTARAFSQWAPHNGDTTRPRATWHEIARPQIHGYDLTTLAFVQGVRHRIITGADEKLLRVFDAPQTFVDTLTAVSGVDLGAEGEGERVVDRPLAASQPALGLSNKPYYAGGAGPDGEDSNLLSSSMAEDEGGPLSFEQQKPFVPSTHTFPPYEEDLLQATLWPEIMKLYGHGNEIVAVSCSNNGAYIATACKGTTPETSAIRLWSTKTWESLGVIPAHTLTVTQMVFSHNDRFLLTVSRDRQFCILEKNDQEGEGVVPYKIVTTKAKAHARILWGGDWSHDDVLFATAARDQTVKVWAGQAAAKLVTTIETSSPATAVAFAPRFTHSSSSSPSSPSQYVLAVGQEDGRITLWSGAAGDAKWTSYLQIPAHLGHVSVVRRMRWQTRPEDKKREKEEKKIEDPSRYLLATCSSDWSVRLFSLAIP